MILPPVSGLRHDGFQPLRVGGRGLDGELLIMVPQAGPTSSNKLRHPYGTAPSRLLHCR